MLLNANSADENSINGFTQKENIPEIKDWINTGILVDKKIDKMASYMLIIKCEQFEGKYQQWKRLGYLILITGRVDIKEREVLGNKKFKSLVTLGSHYKSEYFRKRCSWKTS